MKNSISMGTKAILLIALGFIIGNVYLSYSAQQTIVAGSGIYWDDEKDKLNDNFDELYTILLTSAGLSGSLNNETGTGLAVFNISPTLQGAISRVGTAVDDDDCTGQQGSWWWDSTDSVFEFCESNSGVPEILGGGAGSMVYPGIGIGYTTTGSSWATSLTLVTSVGSTGSDSSIPTEQAVREAFSSIAYNMGGALSNLLFNTGDNFLNDSETDTDHALSASKIIALDKENRSKDIVIEDPDAADEWFIFKATSAMTISDIHCIATAGTSVVIDVNECSSTGTGCTSVDAEITCDTNGAEDDGALSNGSIDAGDWVQLEINTVTGTVAGLAVSIYY